MAAPFIRDEKQQDQQQQLEPSASELEAHQQECFLLSPVAQ
jgi:hypothetical protein